MFCEQYGTMRQERQQRRPRTIVRRTLLGLGVILVVAGAWWMIRYCRVEIAIRAFASNPSLEGTRKLVALLENHSPTSAQAARMLKLLLWPKVATRSAYALGKKPTISVAVPFYFRSHNSLIIREGLFADEWSEPADYPYFTHVSTVPRVLTCPVTPSQAGKFSMRIQYRCSLAPSPRDLFFYFSNPVGHLMYRLLTWMGAEPEWKPEDRWYHARFSVPVDVNIVEPARAEQVQLVSNPELDNLMKGAFRSEVLSGHSGASLGLHISAKRLPIDAAFRYARELPDGTRITSSKPWNERFYVYAGRDFALDLRLEDFRLSRPGSYEGRFVFEPDPDYALEEPTIKSMWNGRLEFPAHFTIAPEPNTAP